MLAVVLQVKVTVAGEQIVVGPFAEIVGAGEFPTETVIAGDDAD